MDDRKFDQLARTLATTRSRRQVLRGLTASALAGGMVALGLKATSEPSAAAAEICHGAQAQCEQDSDCCSGNCDTENGVCATASEGDPCDPSNETSCNTAGLTCCADDQSSTGGTCTSVDTGCPGGDQSGDGNDQGGTGQQSSGGGGPVSSLPNTGSGATAKHHNDLIAASLIGGAGAALVGRTLKRNQSEPN